MDTEKLDIVYFLKNGVPSEEVRYSLRSLKNLPHKNVWIYGSAPRWIQNVKIKQCVQNGTKWQNTSKMMLAVVNNPKISSKFIVMNDDFFILKPIDKLECYCEGNLEERVERTFLRPMNWGVGHYSRYGLSLKETLDWLKAHGYPTVNYEVHIPMVFEKSKMRKCLEAFPRGGYAARRSLYGNMYQIPATNLEHDVKIYNTLTGFPTKGIKNFLSTTDRSFVKGVAGQYIRKRFDEKCEYEQ